RNSQYPIIVKSSNGNEQLRNLLEKVRPSSLLHIEFFREMIDFEDDALLQAALQTKNDSDVELLGLGVFGLTEEVNALTKKFDLWK
ncbi:MAG: DUF2000 family protein, partial [Candidatus Paceibacterota bacterium]